MELSFKNKLNSHVYVKKKNNNTVVILGVGFCLAPCLLSCTRSLGLPT